MTVQQECQSCAKSCASPVPAIRQPAPSASLRHPPACAIRQPASRLHAEYACVLTAVNLRQPLESVTLTGSHAYSPLSADDVTALPAVIVTPVPGITSRPVQGPVLQRALASSLPVHGSWKRRELRGSLEPRCIVCNQPRLLTCVSPLPGPAVIAFPGYTSVIITNLVSAYLALTWRTLPKLSVLQLNDF